MSSKWHSTRPPEQLPADSKSERSVAGFLPGSLQPGNVSVRKLRPVDLDRQLLELGRQGEGRLVVGVVDPGQSVRPDVEGLVPLQDDRIWSTPHPLDHPLQVFRWQGNSTGYGIAGISGSKVRIDNTVAGGGANLVSRLESHAKAGDILFSCENDVHAKGEILSARKSSLSCSNPISCRYRRKAPESAGSPAGGHARTFRPAVSRSPPPGLPMRGLLVPRSTVRGFLEPEPAGTGPAFPTGGGAIQGFEAGQCLPYS